MATTTVFRNAAWVVAWDETRAAHVYRRGIDVTIQGTDIVFLFDATSLRLIRANLAFTRILGYEQDEVPSLTTHELSANDPVTVFVYGRPGHWRNCWEMAALALEELKQRLGDRVRIVTAGAWAEGSGADMARMSLTNRPISTMALPYSS